MKPIRDPKLALKKKKGSSIRYPIDAKPLSRVEVDQAKATNKLPKKAFIGYKKFRGDHIGRVLIPEGVKRNIATSNHFKKCRASQVKVISISSENGKTKKASAESSKEHENRYGNKVRQQYKPGEIVKCHSWDSSSQACGGGIHFFLTRKEAVEYNWR